jgi:hypothetical protein
VQTPPELAIRLQRNAFNRALADHDLPAIEACLTPNTILVTGTDSAVLAGRKAQMLAWKREFAAPRPTAYSRIPETITVSPVEPIAFEQGTWQGLSDGVPLAGGAYTAKWRQVGATWLIEAELYLTLS